MLENENYLLGCLLLQEQENDLVADDFDDYKNRLVFNSIKVLMDSGEPVDIMTITSQLRKTDELSEVGEEKLSDLISVVTSVSNYDFYYKRVKEQSRLRKLTDIANLALIQINGGLDSVKLISQLEDKLASLQSTEKSKGDVDTKSEIEEILANVKYLKANPQDTTGIPTGWDNLNRKTSGLHETDLIILAARPAIGKSSFALQLARNVAVEAKIPTLFFSLEMGAEQLIQRLISCESKVELNKLKSGKVSDMELQALELGGEIIRTAPLFFNDKAGIQLKDIRVAIKSHNARHTEKLGFIIVDYLQLMATGKNTSNMVSEVTEISRGLKMIAKDFNIPVLALSQLSRNVESRGGKPRLSDLRDSGSIEQDADIVMFLNSEAKEPDSYGGKDVQLIIAKHRNGACGELDFNFNAAKMNFIEVDNINKW